jgi:hypothetical protein
MPSHSLARFMDPDVQDSLSELLDGLVRDLRLILTCPALPDIARLSAVQAAVDERAPAPGPDDHRFRLLSPAPGSDAARLCDVITEIRRVLVHQGMISRDKLAAVCEVLMLELVS